MTDLKDNVMESVSGGRGFEGPADFPIDLPLFRELTKEAGLADLAKAEQLYSIFVATGIIWNGKLSKAQLSSPAAMAENRAVLVEAVRAFLASPAALAIIHR